MENPTKVGDSLEKLVLNYDREQQNLDTKIENLIELLEILIDLNEKNKNLQK